MSFLYPLGLIALIGIPILIIIYIIKPRYQEKKITSTYIWRLSLKYKKKKRPIQWLQKSLLFFIQLLIITLLALSIAKPEFNVFAKSKEKIIILDASASMNAENNGKTIFEEALDKTKAQARTVNEDTPMTIILANDNPEYLVNRETSTKYIDYVLKNLKCTFESADYEKAVELANEVLDINKDAQVILYTDHNFSQEGYIDVYNLSNKEWNAGISDFKVELENGYYVFKAKVENYNQRKKLQVYLNVDNKKYEKTIELPYLNNETASVSFKELKIANFVSAKLSLQIDGKKINDDFTYDNEFMIYANQNKKFKVLLAGGETGFINAALRSTGVCNVTKIDKEEDIVYEGYDIYIFDNITPEIIPTDGATWLFNQPDGQDVLDFAIINEEKGKFVLQPSQTNTQNYQQLMKDTYLVSDILLTKYQKVTTPADYEVIATCNGDPVILTGKYDKANVIIFAFDLHYTDLPLNINMAILFNNMVNYSAHQLTNKFEYNVGDNITLYPKLRTNEMTINGETIYTSKDLDNIVYYSVLKPGRYEVIQTLNDGSTITNYFFVRMDQEETNFNLIGEILAADEYNSLSQTTFKSTNKVDIIFYVALILLVLIIFEWGLSYHEQY